MSTPTGTTTKPRRVPRKKAAKATKRKHATVKVQVTDTGVVTDAPVHTHQRATDVQPVAAVEVKPRKRATKKAAAKPAATKAPAKATRKAAKAAAPAPARKSSSKKTATKKAAAKKGETKKGGFRRELNLHGFVPGTDTALIVDALLEGGKDRHDATAKAVKRIEKANGLSTRGGGTKNVPSLISGLMVRLVEKGYRIESTWRLKPPANVAKKMEAEAAAKAAAKSK